VKATRTRALHKRTSHHTAAKVHKAAKKHKPAAKAKKAPKRTAAQVKAAHARALSAGWSCCAAEAVAASLRLSGWPVSGAEVVNLYRLTADGPDAAASIVATLEAAAVHGLAGIRPACFGPVALDDPAAVILGLDLPEAPHAVCADPSGAVWSWGGLYEMTAEAVLEEAWTVTWELASRWWPAA
jgi:hypothetical protein